MMNAKSLFIVPCQAASRRSWLKEAQKGTFASSGTIHPDAVVSACPAAARKSLHTPLLMYTERGVRMGLHGPETIGPDDVREMVSSPLHVLNWVRVFRIRR